MVLISSNKSPGSGENKIYDEKLVSNRFNKVFTTLSADTKFNDEESFEFIDNSFAEFKLQNKLRIPNSLFEFKQTTSEEVLKIIKESDEASSAGFSGMPIKLIKACTETLCIPLAKLTVVL